MISRRSIAALATCGFLAHCASEGSSVRDAYEIGGSDSNGSSLDKSSEVDSALAKRGPVSFLVTSDVHFGNGVAEHDHDPMEAEEIEEPGRPGALTVLQKNQLAADAIALAASPASAAALAARGISNKFRGLVVTGDVTEDGQPDQWREFVDTYPQKLGLLGIPVYETAGNHDYAIKPDANIYKSPNEVFVLSKIAERATQANHPGLLAQTKGGSYAWKWDDVLFINLGVKASDRNDTMIEAKNGSGFRNTNPFSSLTFLKNTLRKYGNSSSRIILSFHYPMVAGDHRMTFFERLGLYEALKGYPVAAILHGHRHKSDLYSWCGIPVFEADTPRSLSSQNDASVIAVEVSGYYLTAQTIHFRQGDTGKVKVGLDPVNCDPKKEDSYCWSFRKKLSTISLDGQCDIQKTVSLR